MTTENIVVPGVVNNGVVVPNSVAALPEGVRVEIVLSAPVVTPELQAEFDAWDRASDEAWRHIKELEQQVP